MSLRRMGTLAAGIALTGTLVAAGGATAWADGTASPSATPGAAASVAPSSTPIPPASTPSASSTGDPDVHTGAHRLCKRVPALQRRITNELNRLNGSATEKGSIAALTALAQKAQSAGETAIYNYREDRLTFRKSLVPTLQQRASDLTQVSTWCSANGMGS